LHIDTHHTIEGIAITLGQALADSLTNKQGLTRYGWSLIPLDESLTRCVVDLSGRGSLTWNDSFSKSTIGGIETEMFEHFFYSLSVSMQATIHVHIEGKNHHHMIESCFKSFAHALKQAKQIQTNTSEILSTKEVL